MSKDYANGLSHVGKAVANQALGNYSTSGVQTPREPRLSERVEEYNGRMTDCVNRLDMMLDRIRGTIPTVVAVDNKSLVRSSSITDHIDAQGRLSIELLDRLNHIEQYI